MGKRASQSTRPIVLLGAERQAATSFALAWPEQLFRFISDQPVIDGWDLENVDICYGTPAQEATSNIGPELSHFSIPLCPRWICEGDNFPANSLGRFDLDAVMEKLNKEFPRFVLPVYANEPKSKKWIVKGNKWHRPDAPVVGSSTAVVSDPYACGVVFQEYMDGAASFIAIGRRTKAGAMKLGLFSVHRESLARDDVLIAGETVEVSIVIDTTLTMLEALEHEGFVSLNWLSVDDRWLLSSCRPVPRAGLCSLLRSGVDCLSMDGKDICVARGGQKFVAEIHYSNYKQIQVL